MTIFSRMLEEELIKLGSTPQQFVQKYNFLARERALADQLTNAGFRQWRQGRLPRSSRLSLIASTFAALADDDGAQALGLDEIVRFWRETRGLQQDNQLAWPAIDIQGPPADSKLKLFRMIRAKRKEFRIQEQLALRAREYYTNIDMPWSRPVPYFLAATDWQLDRPIPLTGDTISYLLIEPDANPFEQTGLSGCWPPDPTGKTIDKYSEAVTAYDSPEPNLWTNDTSYRLMAVSRVAEDKFDLAFSDMTYFDGFDSWAALEYESIAQLLAGQEFAGPHRNALGNPFDLTNRNVALGISVLTLRRDPAGRSQFYLHYRQGTATLNNMFGALPAGEFQPSSKGWEAIKNDLDIWGNILREYGEELLGDEPARFQTASGPDYMSREPYLSLDRNRGEGVRPYLLDIGLDPITLKAGLRVVCVFDADVFDEVFGDMRLQNDEGEIHVPRDMREKGGPYVGFPFTEESVKKKLDSRDLTQAARYLLEATWFYRTELGVGD